MRFLFFGRDHITFDQLKQAWNRSDFELHKEETPESGCFALLNSDVDAVFLDLTDAQFGDMELLSTLFTLKAGLEVVLIASGDELSQQPLDGLRQCFGVLRLPMSRPENLIVLSQLTKQLSLRKKLRQLEDSSITDGLTGLFNHAYIQQQIGDEVNRCRATGDQVSLAFLDIDNFKSYNDQNGHPEGDKVLRTVAEVLNGCVRRFDLIGRYGGEEFVILLPGTSLNSAVHVAERCRYRIEHTSFTFGHKQPLGFVSASFGVAFLDRIAIKTRADLLRIADQALYRAKEGGRNQVWYFRDDDFKRFKPKKTKMIVRTPK